MKKNFLLFLLPLVLVFIWFQHGGMLAGAEEGLPFYNATKMWALSSSLWMPIETGLFAIDLYPRLPLAFVFQGITALHIPIFLFQAVLFYFLIFTGIVSVYYLTREFIQGRSRDLVSLVAAIFYLLNPYAMTQIWQRGLYAQYFMFALLPLSLYLFVRGLTQRKIQFVMYLTLTSLLFSTAFGLVTNILVFWSVLFLYFCFWLGNNPREKSILWGISFLGLSGFFWILIHAWWFIPLAVFKQDIFGGKAGDVLGNIGILTEVSRFFTFPTIIRLLQDFYFFKPGLYGALYTYNRFELLSWILPIMVIVAGIGILKQKKLFFFLLLFLVSLFFCLGPNVPFGKVFVFLFNHITLLQAFRNPYEKYGIVFMLAYAPLFAYGLYLATSMFKKIFDRFLIIPAFLICLYVLLFTSGFYLWPMWKGLYKNPVAVPTEYAAVNDYLAKAEKDATARLFILPFQGEGVSTTWNFSGLDPAIFTFDRSSLSYKFQTKYTYDISHNLYSYLGQVNEFPIYSLMNVKYLVTRGDLQNVDQSQLSAISLARDPQYSHASDVYCRFLVHTGSVTCPVPIHTNSFPQSEFGGMYVAVIFHTDIPAEISFTLKNNNATVSEWLDQGNSEYQTQEKTTKELLLPVELTFQEDGFHPTLSIQAKSLFSKRIPKITLEGVRLIPYVERSLDESKLVYTKGMLSVYALKNKNTQPIVTLLPKVKKVMTFRDFFSQVERDKDQIPWTGYLLPIQNPNVAVEKFLSDGNAETIMNTKVSDTRYLVDVIAKKPTVLALNQTFSPQWKVVPLRDKQMIQNSLLSNIKLFFASYLSEDVHAVGNGYANFWLLPTGTYHYGIIFLPQVYSDVAAVVSITSAIGMVTYVFFNRKYDKYW